MAENQAVLDKGTVLDQKTGQPTGAALNTALPSTALRRDASRENKPTVYDVVIVGGGVCGSALLYSLSQYTNVGKVALIEKNADVALVNSRPSSNSQTLHFGDIETNYTLEKAETVNRGASMVKSYLLQHDMAQAVYTKYHKMVLAVGSAQVQKLRERYEIFKGLFPDLRLIERAEIEALEPNVLRGRNEEEETLALFTPEGYTVDYQKLSQSFVQRTMAESGDSVELMMETKVRSIAPVTDEQGNERFIITTDKQTITAKTVAVTSGAHSLLFAKELGYGMDYALLSVAGSFYFAPHLLNGKVYTVQLAKLPFAAIHGDPEVHDAQQTRFGPTAKVMPLLERHKYGTMWEYFKTAGLSIDAFVSFFNILSDWTILFYIIMNFIYDIPFIGKRLFIRKVRKIVPSITLKDLQFAKGYGGIRPQIVNLKTRKLEMGEAKISGRNILFNITPSPGASTCLKTAADSCRELVDFLGEGYRFDEAKMFKDLS
ncbi:MAG: FAD-dependent oxidoreductase [Cyanobacteria bacterium J06627_28]